MEGEGNEAGRADAGGKEFLKLRGVEGHLAGVEFKDGLIRCV